MTTLHPDLETLMPEPVKLVTACEDCCGTGHTGESQYMGEFQPPEYERCGSCDGSGKWIVDHHSPTQMREAILAATERAAKVRQVAVPDAADEAFRLRKLTGQLVAPVGRGYAEGWKAGYEAAKERAATLCEQRAVNAPFMEGHLSAMECAAAIRGAA